MRTSAAWILSLVALTSFATRPAAARIGFVTHVGQMSLIRGNRIAAPFPVGDSPSMMAFSPSGARLYVTDLRSDNGYQGDLVVLNPATSQILATVPLGGLPGQAAVHPDGSRVYVPIYDVLTGANARVMIIDTTTLATTAVPVPFGASGAAIDPASGRLYVTSVGGSGPVFGSVAGAFTVIDTTTDTVAASAPLPGGPRAIVLHRDGSRAYAATLTATIMIIDTATLSLTGSIPAGAFGGLAIESGGRNLYAANPNGALSIIDTTTETIRAQVPLGPSYGLAVDPKTGKLWVGEESSLAVVNVGCRPRVVHRRSIGRTPVGIAFEPCPSCAVRPSRPCP